LRVGRRERPDFSDPPDSAPTDEPLLDADLLRELGRLRFATLSAILDGFVGEGEGRAGAARIEFADYRNYTPGDDLRRIDWNVYRRLGQLVVRVGSEDTRLSLALLVDVSRSMRFGEPTKLFAAKRLAAVLSGVALLAGETVEIHVLGDGRSLAVARLDGPKQIARLVDGLSRLPVTRTTGLDAALEDYARQRPLTDLAILLTDANQDVDAIRSSVRTLASCARATGLVQVVAPDELTTRLRGPVELRDSESGRTLEATIDDRSAAEYAASFEAFSATIEDACRLERVGYVRAVSDEDPLDVLLAHATELAIRLDR
jgi:uncharacterized protein (DUF58 family)